MVSIKCQIILIIPLLLNFFFILTELKNTLILLKYTLIKK